MGLAELKAKTLSTPEDYLTFEREADTRHEFLDGEIYASVGFVRTGETSESGEVIMRFSMNGNNEPPTIDN